MSMLVPTELGGGGASHAEACAVLSELARGCPSTSLSYSMHSHVVGAQVWRHHHDLPAPVLGKVAASQMTLISTGASDWIESSGSAVQVDGGFRISARKMPASGCPGGDVLVTSICWNSAPEGPHVIHCSIPFAADGVSILPTWDTMGMRGTGSDTVVLDDVFVPDESVALIRPAGVVASGLERRARYRPSAHHVDVRRHRRIGRRRAIELADRVGPSAPTLHISRVEC